MAGRVTFDQIRPLLPATTKELSRKLNVSISTINRQMRAAKARREVITRTRWHDQLSYTIVYMLKEADGDGA